MQSYNKDFEKERFIRIKPQRLPEEVFRRLKEAILEGHYLPGDRLPSEKTFCEAFGVGRPVIREALCYLENSGFISVRAGAKGGAFVQKVDASILFNTFEGIVKLDGISTAELIEARLSLEKAILPLILERVSKTDIEALKANLREMSENLEKGIKGKRDYAFHVLLFKTSRNKLLIKIGDALFTLMSKLLDQCEYSEARLRVVLEEHIALVELLDAGKLKKAQQAMESHINKAIDDFRSLIALAPEEQGR